MLQAFPILLTENKHTFPLWALQLRCSSNFLDLFHGLIMFVPTLKPIADRLTLNTEDVTTKSSVIDLLVSNLFFIHPCTHVSYICINFAPCFDMVYKF